MERTTSNQPWYLKKNIPWREQVMTVLPIVLFAVSLLQLLAVYKYFDLSIYDNQSVEIVGGSINTLWEKIFALNSVFIVVLNFLGLIGLILKQKWSFTIILLSSLLMLVNGFVMLNVISVVASIIWITLLLRIRADFV
jgi:hypothetical protein